MGTPKKTGTQDSIPQSVTLDILNYLEQQERINIHNENWDLHDGTSGLLRAQSILEEIIGNVANRAQFIEEFQARLKAHNQFPLFDLSTFIPEFSIDDAMYEKLTFRENLVISSFQGCTSSLVPQIVGGLCLDVQQAKGSNPLQRKDVGLEQKLVEQLTQKANEMRAAHRDPLHSTLSPEGPRPSPGGSVEQTGDEKVEETTESQQELNFDFIASITPRFERPYCKFLVHLSSQFDVAGQIGGSRITAWVDRNFHTLEEKRTEYVINNDEVAEKMLYCALQARRYYLKHRSTPEKLVDCKYYSMGKARDLVCEGSNFILMRYLSITRYIGTFELSTMYINGDMCRNIYECFGPESGVVNDTKLDLCKIHRTVIEECGITHRCITILTLSGRIVKQEWNDCEYILQVNPLAEISNETPIGNERILLPRVWETDMQLFSKFLDTKTTCTMEMKSYLADHIEFTNMMSDYVQSTLLMKPEDILDFTIKHFTQYYPHLRNNSDDLSQDEFDEQSYIRL